MREPIERQYRHGITGLTQRLDPRTAAADPNLVEVADDAKPLAYTPIPPEAIESLLAAKDKPAGGDAGNKE